MTTREESLSIRFLDYLYINYGNVRHVKRIAPSIGPIIWKLYQVAQLSLNRVRQIRFSYRGHNFKGRYSHHRGGRIEIVEVIGRRDGRTLCVVTNLTEAMQINFETLLNNFTRA